MADLRVNFCGVELKNPVTTASGTFGFGHEYANFYDLGELGGVGAKGLTPEEQLGNPAPRIAETPMGILNCVGLQNPGVDRFIQEEIPYLRQFDTKIIANVSGHSVEEYVGIVEKISDADIDLIEMNISCPNVKCGGLTFGTQPKMVEEVVSAAKAVAKKPLIVKLTPNVTDIAEIARAAVSAGADALSLINTLLGMRIDVESRRPILSNIMGGLSGCAHRRTAPVSSVTDLMPWLSQNASSSCSALIGAIGSAKRHGNRPPAQADGYRTPRPARNLHGRLGG